MFHKERFHIFSIFFIPTLKKNEDVQKRTNQTNPDISMLHCISDQVLYTKFAHLYGPIQFPTFILKFKN